MIRCDFARITASESLALPTQYTLMPSCGIPWCQGSTTVGMLDPVAVGLALPEEPSTALTGFAVLPDANCEQPARAAVTAPAAIVVLNRRRAENNLFTAPSITAFQPPGGGFRAILADSGTT